MFRTIALSTKLLIALGLPLVALLGLTALRVNERFAEVEIATEQLDEVERTLTLNAIPDALSAERDAAASLDSTPQRVERARNAFDNAVATFLTNPGQTPQSTIDTVVEVRDLIVANREVLPMDPGEMRSQMAEELVAGDVAEGSTGFALSQYGPNIRRLSDLIRYEPQRLIDAGTAQNLTTLVLVDRMSAAVQNELLTYIQLSQLPPEAISLPILTFSEVQIAQSESAESALNALSGSRWSGKVDALFADDSYARLNASRDFTGNLLVGDAYTVSPLDSNVQSSIFNAKLGTLRGEIIDQVRGDAIALRDDARGAAISTMVLAGVLTLGLLLLMFALYRSIRRPITQLTERSRQVANVELPATVASMRTLGDTNEIPEIEPIKADSKDEIGELVAAFNEMSSTAVNLAGEQAASRRVVADMFVNLGRRNQKLLMRILSYLDTLEKEQKDPATLEALFKVDHLATRMRRNAESLLVLAGAKSSRVFTNPVPIGDVVRSALAEVEGYERVDLDLRDNNLVDGSLVADMAHLLAELIENAVSFSPPDRPILVVASESARGFVVAVADQGKGMTAEEIDAANLRITEAATLEETPSKFLGHHVVGRLAGNHGLSVELSEGFAGGVIARITIPDEKFASTEEPAAPAVDTDEDDATEISTADFAALTAPDSPAALDDLPSESATAERAANAVTNGDQQNGAHQHDEVPVAGVEAHAPAPSAMQAPAPVADATQPEIQATRQDRPTMDPSTLRRRPRRQTEEAPVAQPAPAAPAADATPTDAHTSSASLPSRRKTDEPAAAVTPPVTEPTVFRPTTRRTPGANLPAAAAATPKPTASEQPTPTPSISPADAEDLRNRFVSGLAGFQQGVGRADREATQKSSPNTGEDA